MLNGNKFILLILLFDPKLYLPKTSKICEIAQILNQILFFILLNNFFFIKKVLIVLKTIANYLTKQKQDKILYPLIQIFLHNYLNSGTIRL